MKQIQLFITLVIGQLLFSAPIKAADIPDSTTVSKQHYYAAKEQFKDMLSGKEKLSYEKAITIVENAYYENQVNLVDFNLLIDFHVQNINRIIEINYDESALQIEQVLHKTEEQQIEEYKNALINWAIYSYITDTTLFLVNNQLFYHLPYEYSYEDPLGTVNWQTTQVFNLLDNKTGNCYALASLFKIFSERLNSEAFICTAPGHIYIRHADHKGIYHNVELGSKAFPGTGSLETLTYTTDEATKNGISLRELDLKQSVALNLVYLAKGYAYKFGVKDDNFIMECAELALQYDELNLNAMLLKAEVLEERLIKKDKTIKALQADKTFQQYEKLITHLFDLGYREMPTEMKDLVISRLRKEDSPYPMTNHTPKPFEDLGVKEERYATLSNGLFDEQMLTKPVEQYHRTMFDTKQKKITELVELDTTYNNYPVDLVVFAWNVDPLATAFPFASPYTFAANNPIWFIDFEGMMPVTRTFSFNGQTYTFKTDTETPQDFIISSGFLGLKRTRFDFRSTNNNRKSLALLRSGHSQEIRKHNDVRKMSSVHKGVLVTELLLSALEQNPDIKLVIVGNHAIPTVEKLMEDRLYSLLDQGAANLKSIKGNVTVKGEDRTFETDANFSRDRANFVKEQFFNNSSLVNTGAAQADFNSSSFPNVNIPDLGKDAVGITIVFDFTKTVPNPKPPKSGGGKKAPTREVYRSVRFLCFAEGTKVLMGDKENLNIEDIKIGDVILNYNEALNQIEIDTVTHIDKVVHNNIIEIMFNNDEINVNTDDHPYLVKGKGWCSYRPALTEKNYGIKCQKLEVGDFCYYYGETSNEVESVRISRISKLNKNIMTYNLTGLAKNSNYIANGVIVSNETKPKTNEIYMLPGAYEEKISNQKIKTKEKKKAKEIAQSWLLEKSDSLNIPTLQLSELRYNPDEATMLLLDDYEEQENILSDEEKKERMKEIEKSGFYFIYSSYTNKVTNKKHTIEFVYNLIKEISYVHIQEVENKDNFYFENLVDWSKNKY